MVTKLKVTRIGDGLGLVLPDALLARLGARVGDMVTLREVAGGFEISGPAGGAGSQLETVREVMARRKGALGDLAD